MLDKMNRKCRYKSRKKHENITLTDQKLFYNGESGERFLLYFINFIFLFFIIYIYTTLDVFDQLFKKNPINN